MRSLRARLLVGLFGLFTAIALVAGIVAYALDRQEVDATLDSQLHQVANNVGDTDFPVSPQSSDGVQLDPEDVLVVTIWDRLGQAHSSDPAFAAVRPEMPGYTDVQVAGEPWRTYTRIDRTRTIQVAQRMVVRQEFAANSAWRALLPIAALIPLTWLVLGWGVRRALRPLDALTTQLRHWEKGERDKLALEGVPGEILPLALATNQLVTRLQGQIEFRERFISDAAHELRTPLTALRLQVENLRAGTTPEQTAVVLEMASGVRRMSDMVGKLLQLARADAVTATRRQVSLNLADAIAVSLRSVMPMAVEKEIDIGVVAGAPEMVVAEPDDMQTLISNLLDNAVRYTPPHGAVDLALARDGSEVSLEVRDTGPGIPEQHLGRVFGRFFRVPGTGGEGSGLGLPIVQAIAERCGARVTLANRRDRTGLVARIVFAAAAPSGKTG